jgi:hypothetical protein
MLGVNIGKTTEIRHIPASIQTIPNPFGPPHTRVIPAHDEIEETGRRLQWQRAKYPDLVTAYFALKEMYEGTGPEYTQKLKDSDRIKAEMKVIAKVLTQKHAEKMSKELSYGLSDEDKKALGNPHEKIVRATEDFLLGNAPEKYQPRVNRMLDKINSSEGRWKERGKTTYAWGKKLVYDPHAWVASKAYTGVTETGKFTWANKGKIAGLATCALFGGPIGIAAYYAMQAA